MNRETLQSLRSALRPMVVVVVVCLLAGVGIGVVSMAHLVRTLTARIDTAAAAQSEQKQLDAFQDRLKKYAAQVNGRSLFFAPRASQAVEPPLATKPTEPSKPVYYGGPAVIAMINNAAWFSNGQRIAVGQEADGVKVLALNAPWSVHVFWRGVEFDVGLFDRDSVVYRQHAADRRGYVPPAPVTYPAAASSTSPAAGRASAPRSDGNGASSPPATGIVMPLMPPPSGPGNGPQPPSPPQSVAPGASPPGQPTDPNGPGGPPGTNPSVPATPPIPAEPGGNPEPPGPAPEPGSEPREPQTAPPASPSPAPSPPPEPESQRRGSSESEPAASSLPVSVPGSVPAPAQSKESR